MMYECWVVEKNIEEKMKLLRWMSGVTKENK